MDVGDMPNILANDAIKEFDDLPILVQRMEARETEG